MVGQQGQQGRGRGLGQPLGWARPTSEESRPASAAPPAVGQQAAGELAGRRSSARTPQRGPQARAGRRRRTCCSVRRRSPSVKMPHRRCSSSATSTQPQLRRGSEEHQQGEAPAMEHGDEGARDAGAAQLSSHTRRPAGCAPSRQLAHAGARNKQTSKHGNTRRTAVRTSCPSAPPALAA